MRTPKNVLSKIEHRRGRRRSPARRRPGAERCTSSSNGARMNVGCTRSAPVWLVEGRLATSNFTYLPGIVRAPLDIRPWFSSGSLSVPVRYAVLGGRYATLKNVLVQR